MTKMKRATNSKLAIRGGAPAISKAVKFHIWPGSCRRDEQFVLASLRQPVHTFGPNCVALQQEFAQWNGNKFCAATNSGTAALHMGLAACGVGAGDEVITTTLSWTSTATCIVHHNAIPIFVDIDWVTMLLDPAKLEAAITPRTKAIMPVHYWGLACDMDPILKIARKHKLKVIEDCCQGHAATYKGRKVGTFGDCAAFSLNQNKNFSAGEGGLFVCDNEKLYTDARAVMSFGEMRAPEAKRDFHSYALGWMYRTNDVSAAYSRSALKGMDANNVLALANWHRLNEGLADLPDLVRPVETSRQKTNGYAYVIRVNPASPARRGTLAEFRDAVVEALTAEGVSVAPARMSLPAHTVIQAKQGYGKGCPWSCPHARKNINYDLKQWPVTQDTVDSSIQIAINAHRPPNGPRQIDAIVRGVRKVFENLDQIPVKKAKA